jgi:hypothetical protein
VTDLRPQVNGMPSLSHLATSSSFDAALNRWLPGLGNYPAPTGPLLVHLTRLTDKAILEYESARESLDVFIKGQRGGRLTDLVRVYDHLETCFDAIARAARFAEALRTEPGAPVIHLKQLPTPAARDRVRDVRNAVQHAEEDLLKGETPQVTGRPSLLIARDKSLGVARKGMYIRYDHLAKWLTCYHDLVRDLISRR